MIIAIDGPAAAGKGTLARRLAAHFGLAYLDTGALYRAVAWRLLEAAGDPSDREAAVAAAAAALGTVDTDDPALRSEAVGEAAARIAAIPEVRAIILKYQHDFAAGPQGSAPGSFRGAVLDGRDIGTVVFPDADHKLFVTANDEERARRRAAELRGRGEAVSEEQVLAEIRARDAQDREREAAPLVQAGDALLLETTNLDIDSAFAKALALISSE